MPARTGGIDDGIGSDAALSPWPPPSRGHDRGRVPAAGLTGRPLDRARHRHGRHHATPDDNRGADRGHPAFALLDALSPARCRAARRSRRPPAPWLPIPGPWAGSAPTATMVRRLWGDSSEARHTRVSPERTYSWALSPVWSRRAARTGAATSTSDRLVLPLASPTQTHQAGPEHEATQVVSTDEQVALEGRGQAMSGGPRQRRRPGQLAQGQRARPRAPEVSPRPCPALRHRLHSLPSVGTLSQNVR